jgi:hypothetical protein
MPDLPVTFQDVVRWIHESLPEYQGLYDVQDLTFVRGTVRVVTPRRDALFDVARTHWGDLTDPTARPVITEDLRRWASQHLVVHR